MPDPSSALSTSVRIASAHLAKDDDNLARGLAPNQAGL